MRPSDNVDPRKPAGVHAVRGERAFDLLAKCIPEVNDTVLWQYAKNLKYWEGERRSVRGKSRVPALGSDRQCAQAVLCS